MQAHPDAYPKEIAKEFNCCETAIRKAFERLGITRKKTIYYREQDPEKVKACQKEIAEITPEQIAYVDETGIDTYLCREYGYGPRGQKVNAAISGRKYKRVGMVAVQLDQEIISPLAHSGTMDSSLFQFWFEKQLLPALPPGAVVVMDNASFHRKAQLICIAQKYGFRLIFLPPYSPEFNPIENFWVWLKRYLRSSLPACKSFDCALFDAFQVC